MDDRLRRALEALALEAARSARSGDLHAVGVAWRAVEREALRLDAEKLPRRNRGSAN
jgi:hypothetical protein